MIIASLGYVGLELNQNTTAIQQSSYQATLDMLTEGDYLLASDEDLNRIVLTAERDPSQLDDEEWSRFTRYAFPRLGSWEYIYLSRQSNSISETHWSAFNPYFADLICNSGYKKFFEENTIAFDDSAHAVYARLCLSGD
jgi:hypothetical protein